MPTTTITMKSTKVQTLGGDARARKRRSKVDEGRLCSYTVFWLKAADEVKHATK